MHLVGLGIENNEVNRVRAGKINRGLGRRHSLDIQLLAIEHRCERLEGTPPDPRQQHLERLVGHGSSSRIEPWALMRGTAHYFYYTPKAATEYHLNCGGVHEKLLAPKGIAAAILETVGRDQQIEQAVEVLLAEIAIRTRR